MTKKRGPGSPRTRLGVCSHRKEKSVGANGSACYVVFCDFSVSRMSCCFLQVWTLAVWAGAPLTEGRRTSGDLMNLIGQANHCSQQVLLNSVTVSQHFDRSDSLLKCLSIFIPLTGASQRIPAAQDFCHPRRRHHPPPRPKS